jgi:hypothetical protein
VSAFEVTPGDLTALAGQLSSLLGELSHAGDVQSAPTSSAENPQLDTAIQDFISEWIRSLDQSRSDLEALSQRLGAAGTGYQTAEDGVVGAFGAR